MITSISNDDTNVFTIIKAALYAISKNASPDMIKYHLIHFCNVIINI